jgi:hypothetical protein
VQVSELTYVALLALWQSLGPDDLRSEVPVGASSDPPSNVWPLGGGEWSGRTFWRAYGPRRLRRQSDVDTLATQGSAEGVPRVLHQARAARIRRQRLGSSVKPFSSPHSQ